MSWLSVDQIDLATPAAQPSLRFLGGFRATARGKIVIGSDIQAPFRPNQGRDSEGAIVAAPIAAMMLLRILNCRSRVLKLQ